MRHDVLAKLVNAAIGTLADYDDFITPPYRESDVKKIADTIRTVFDKECNEDEIRRYLLSNNRR